MAVPVETLIFLDVDGVLNVGVYDQGNAPVAFNADNLQLAEQLAGRGHPLADRLRAVASREIEHGKDITYKSLVATEGDLSDTLVERLAWLIQSAGTMCQVVLSSSWRRPQHARRAAFLESRISKQLGKPFTFDDRTVIREERTAMDRLKCLGDYVETFCKKRDSNAGKLRLLVLEDFCISALSGLSSNEGPIDSCEDAERYLLRKAGDDTTASVRIIHTFESWKTEQGMRVAIGCGITMEHFSRALKFLDGERCLQDDPVALEDGATKLDTDTLGLKGLADSYVGLVGHPPSLVDRALTLVHGM
mmetsp:Transcript_131853/g.256874  ORF Transcript_131853/g.256874 Transcript_131853/m.256874 type:complete len:305 (-) Transcript_131853:49-963(-)